MLRVELPERSRETKPSQGNLEVHPQATTLRARQANPEVP
jgi:hypothetical protein